MDTDRLMADEPIGDRVACNVLTLIADICADIERNADAAGADPVRLKALRRIWEIARAALEEPPRQA